MALPTNLVVQKNKLDTKYPWLNLIEIQFNDAEDQAKRLVRNFEDLWWFAQKYSGTGSIRHFKMNDNAANTTVLDSSPNTGHGAAQQNTDVLHTTGKVGGALTFNGSTDYVELGDNFSGIVGKANNYSISAWIYATAQPGTIINICPGGASDNRNGINILDGYVQGGYWNGSQYIGRKGPITLDAWHHVVLVNSSGVISLYLDAVSQSVEGIFGLNLENRIGKNASYTFTGKMDDIRIFSRALGQDEINRLYNVGSGTEKIPARYENFNFNLSLIQESSEGELPKTTLSVSNVTQFLQEYIEGLEGLTGATIVLSIVHADNLNEDYAELQTEFEVLATRLTAMDVAFQVGGPSLLAQRHPLHRYFADLCRHKFKNARCGYTGGATSCNRRLADCRTLNNSARFGGFTGLESGTIRIA